MAKMYIYIDDILRKRNANGEIITPKAMEDFAYKMGHSGTLLEMIVPN